MNDVEKEIIRRTYHRIALLVDDRAKTLREAIKDGGTVEAATALENFAGDLWLRINDFDIEPPQLYGMTWPVWSEIDTAPMDGTHIIGYWKGYKHPFICWYNQNSNTFESLDFTGKREEEWPTHWTSLPAFKGKAL